MSNAFAIAAVTATLRNLLTTVLEDDLGSEGVTTKPLDKLKDPISGEKGRVNLFLYHITPNAAYRNMDMPAQVKPGESANPPLALTLYYLVSVFGEDTDVPVTHQLLGKAMGVLNDYPLLGREEIKQALAGNDLHQQIERVRISPQALTVEEISKLWTIFQTQYRISAAYQVSVVLIDSAIPVKAALPVLTRGEKDKGIDSRASAAPVLTAALPPLSQQAARLGENVELAGNQLAIANAVVRFENAALDTPIERAPALDSATGKLFVHLTDTAEEPEAMRLWAPGFYTISFVVRQSGRPTMVSNSINLALAPKITVAPKKASPGLLQLTITCAPRVRENQTAYLVLNDRQIKPKNIENPADKTKATILTFDITDTVKGSYVVRLRVDGVDSIPVIQSGIPPVPTFDPDQQVNVS